MCCRKKAKIPMSRTPANILECISLGVDMFDCVMPIVMVGMQAFWEESSMKNEKWKDDFSPLDANSELFADRYYSKAFIRHLFVNGEMLGSMIGSLHNLYFYVRLVKEARKHILQGDFHAWKEKMIPILSQRI